MHQRETTGDLIRLVRGYPLKNKMFSCGINKPWFLGVHLNDEHREYSFFQI